MTTQSHPETPVNRSAGKLLIVWLIVAVPALWGVSQTAIKSLALFQNHTPAATQPAATMTAQ